MTDLRIGYGYDLHRLKMGRKLIVGGVDIPYERGLDGHSDADVLLHAITDALLGTLALGDIGTHFPDTDPQWKGVDSMILLKAAWKMIQREGYALMNVDSTIIAEKPKMKPYIPTMKKCIAEALGVGLSRVSIKATTSERIGALGREEGIAAMATVLVIRA